MRFVRSRLLSTFAAAAVLAASGAACSQLTGGEPLEPGSVLFEVEYVNFAWAPTWYGFHVDRDGNVSRYRLDNPRPADSADEVFSEAELRAKYDQNGQLLTTLPSGEVLARYQRVDEAIAGPYTEPRGTCADAGGVRYSAMVYDASTGAYRRVLLRQTGDIARANLSAAARELFAWLKQLDPEFAQISGCDPFGG
ncbi:MAG TPA: hypothetical protein VF746_04815 [Longimicrobium sp.]|jgi:hypothetical protein